MGTETGTGERSSEGKGGSIRAEARRWIERRDELWSNWDAAELQRSRGDRDEHTGTVIANDWRDKGRSTLAAAGWKILWRVSSQTCTQQI
jgi:hypothetical protein